MTDPVPAPRGPAAPPGPGSTAAAHPPTDQEPAPKPAPGTPSEWAAWALTAAGIFVVLHYHLLAALLAGLVVYAVLHRLAGTIAGRTVSHGAAKLFAAALMGIVAASVATAAVLSLVGLIRGHLGDLPAVFNKMAEALDQTRLWPEAHGGPSVIPEMARDAEQLKEGFAHWLRTHAREIQSAGGGLGRGMLHAAFGIAIALLIFFRHPTPAGPLALALAERARRLGAAFEAVVFAQVNISAINTACTALYLLAVLPLFGVHLPYAGTLVAVTLLAGLLPVVGNLVSNTVIVVISLGVSVWLAAASLVFLVVVHKLEYVLNAHLIGAQIQAAAWEILAALLVFEAAFGLPGVIIAPIVYAYAKKELQDRGLI